MGNFFFFSSDKSEQMKTSFGEEEEMQCVIFFPSINYNVVIVL